MSRKPFKVNMDFNEALKRTAEYKKDKSKVAIIDNNKVEKKDKNEDIDSCINHTKNE